MIPLLKTIEPTRSLLPVEASLPRRTASIERRTLRRSSEIAVKVQQLVSEIVREDGEKLASQGTGIDKSHLSVFPAPGHCKRFLSVDYVVCS